jgi:prepilin-type N-terminal cleavage/methylation domain-containing protein
MRRGFSLVELLVVIAIVALLAALILPGLARAREYAYFTTCKNSLRQIGIGVLLYASNNRGILIAAGGPCNEPYPDSRGARSRRIGSWRSIEWDGACGRDWIARIYDDWRDDSNRGETWEGGLSSRYMGRPRLPGKYLNIHVMFDPIAIVKNWSYNQADIYTPTKNPAYAGDEAGRDRAARGRGKGLGYATFVGAVGCAMNNLKHIANTWPPGQGSWNGSEAEYRWATKNRDPRTSNKGSIWLAACIEPGDTYFGISMWGQRRRKWFSHFGATKAVEGVFRFNVVHVDGHVDDSIWKSSKVATNQYYPYCIPSSEWGRPYGYVDNAPDGNGIKKEPAFEGAFDDNL